jgi:hypothetical protein
VQEATVIEEKTQINRMVHILLSIFVFKKSINSIFFFYRTCAYAKGSIKWAKTDQTRQDEYDCQNQQNRACNARGISGEVQQTERGSD